MLIMLMPCHAHATYAPRLRHARPSHAGAHASPIFPPMDFNSGYGYNLLLALLAVCVVRHRR
jgi:hypothetical protein